MANVRCPICNEYNPPDAETCVYCGARLKPVRPPTDSISSNPSSMKPEDEPDWLRQLRSDEPTEQTSSPHEKPAEAGSLDVPDWLSRIRGRSQEEGGQEPELQGGLGEPDWMKDLESDTSPVSDEDLLSRLSQVPPVEPGQPEPALSEESELPDWFNNLSGEAGPELGEAGALSQPGEDNFNQRISDQQPGEPSLTAPGQPDEDTGFDLTGFLSNLEEPVAGAPTAGEMPAVEEGGIDWTPPAEGEEQRPSSGFGMTGFLASISGFESARSEDAEQPGDAGQPGDMEEFSGLEQEPGEALPGWQPGQRSTTGPDDLSQPPAEPADGTGMPDWFSEDQAKAAAEPAATEPAAAEPEPVAGGPGAIEPAAEEPAAFELESAQPADALPGEEEAAVGAEGLPDWLSNFDQPEAEKTQPRRVTGELSQSAAPLSAAGEGSPATPEEGSWETTGQEATLPAAGAPSPEESMPDWLRDFQEQTPAGESEAVTPLGGEEALVPQAMEGEQPFAMGLPDWLEDESAGQTAAEQESQAGSGGEELARADLPEWVKEMQPIESIIPEEVQFAEADQRVEKAGPLAGLRGVLPSEEMVARYGKPPVYSMKLRVSEKQHGQSSLLENIVAQESQPLQIPLRRSRTSGLWLRVFIALLMLAVLTVPFLPSLNIQPLATPVLYPADMLQMFDKIDQGLQPGANAPVLLAVDYEPALSGEMRLAALAVVQHLMSKNARIVVISTSPTGPALAQQLLQDASTAYTNEHPQAGYDIPTQVVNLGFLPGGTISLLEFARQPKIAAPVSLSGQMAWQDTFLQDVADLSGFSQVIVLTDRSETGRAWVEQVQPSMGKIPLFMVASAQAAPMLIPYVESSQISGMVNGLLGGAMYARLANQAASPAAGHLAAYQIAIVLAIALILVGGVVSGGLALGRSNEKEEE